MILMCLDNTVTMRAKLVASQADCMGYINYVFENLEYTDDDYKYMMCVRFPNWEQGPINLDDIGFVTVKYVRAGIDEWFDGEEMVKYKYTNIVFMKFVPEKPICNVDEVFID